MEMELKKQKISYYNVVFDASTIHDATCEIIIPDSSPDMVRTISACGRAYLKEKDIREGCCRLSGVISGCVLYVAEGEKCLRKLEVNLPFNHKFESNEIDNDSECVTSAELITFDTREINSRKIAVKAHVAMEIKCYKKNEMEITRDIDNKESFSVEIQKKEADFYAPIFIKGRSFTIIDDIEIPESLPAFESMLKNGVSLNCTDIKLIGNKAITKGLAEIKYTYASADGTIHTVTHNLPYSQIIDVDEFNEGCDLSVKMNIRACDIEPSHDMTGDARYISVNIVVDTSLIAYYSDKITFIDDLYSTTHVLNAQFKEVPTFEMRKDLGKRISVNEIIETTNNVKKVIDTDIALTPVRNTGDCMESDAHIQIIYTDEENEVHCVQRRCCVKCDVGGVASDGKTCLTNVTGQNATGSGNKISVQFYVDYDTKMLKNKKVKNLYELKCAGKRSGENNETKVIVKHIYKEEPLWDLAKRHNTTVDEIAAANCLDFSDTVAAGSMILIPCGK